MIETYRAQVVYSELAHHGRPDRGLECPGGRVMWRIIFTFVVIIGSICR